MIQTILHQRGMDKNSLRSWQQGRQRVMVNIMDSIMDGSYSCLNWCPHSCRKKNIPSPCLRFPCIKTCKNLFDFNRSGYTRSTKWVDCFQIFITSLCQAFLILIQYSALNWCQERYVCGNSWDWLQILDMHVFKPELGKSTFWFTRSSYSPVWFKKSVLHYLTLMWKGLGLQGEEICCWKNMSEQLSRGRLDVVCWCQMMVKGKQYMNVPTARKINFMQGLGMEIKWEGE